MEIFSYTHDISRLLDELRKYEKDLSLEDLEPDQLTSYAVEARYPEPENSLSIERAREAVSIAHQVRNRILEKLNI
ncbi:MAG: HEPN domain-containing protein [Leptospiraceae bacterium]|nr:HEPN domain-containing protein [Leptospiraceae bacterium]